MTLFVHKRDYRHLVCPKGEIQTMYVLKGKYSHLVCPQGGIQAPCPRISTIAINTTAPTEPTLNSVTE